MDDIRAVSQQIGVAADEQLAVSETVCSGTGEARFVTLVGCALLGHSWRLCGQRAFLEAAGKSDRRVGGSQWLRPEVRDLLRTTFYSIADGVLPRMLRPRAVDEFHGGTADRVHRKRRPRQTSEEIFQTAARVLAGAANPVRAALNEEPSRGASNKGPAAPMRLRAKSGAECLVEARRPRSAMKGALARRRLVFHDVTERMQSEERMRQTAKLESLGVLAGGIAHDFNNILVGIVGMPVCLRSIFRQVARPRTSGYAASAGYRARGSPARCWPIPAVASFVVRPVDLSQEVEEIASLVRASIPKNVELRL